jgi:hypothetical protein
MIVNNVHQERCAAIEASYSDIDPQNLTDYGVEVRYPGDFGSKGISGRRTYSILAT